MNKTIELTCERCGEVFARSSRSTAKWCSRACVDAGRRRGEERACIVCGARFYKSPCELKLPGRTNEFCSRACYNVLRPERMTGRQFSETHRAMLSAAAQLRTGPRKPTIERACMQCGESFTVSRKREAAYRERIRFCGTKCWYDYVRDNPGVHPSWRGGYEPYYGPNWPEQARKARKRDGYTCQDCGITQIRPALDVHHLVPRRSFNGDYKAANQIENLVTLCKRCHSKRECALTPQFRPAS